MLNEPSSEYVDIDNPNTLFIHYGNKNSPFKQNKSFEDSINDEEKKTPLNQNENQQTEKKKLVKNSSFCPSEILKNFSEFTQTLLEDQKEDLLKIFQFYCSIGEPMNTKRMKSIKFKKLLKDSGILTLVIIHSFFKK